MSEISRRDFMIGCSAGIIAMGGGRVSGLAFLTPEAASERDLIVNVFLRGGMDCLNFIVPYNDPNYVTARPAIKLLPPGAGAGRVFDLDGFFGIHPSAAALRDLYQVGRVAVIHACGSPDPTRSHFDAMDYMERGVPGDKTVTTGWLTRHLASLAPGPIMQAVASGGSIPKSLQGHAGAIAMSSASSFRLTPGSSSYGTQQSTALRALYTGAGMIHDAGRTTLETVDLIESKSPGIYTPEFGAVYPNSSFGKALMTVAQLAKMDLGLHIATVDLGGWDTHEYQGSSGAGVFGTQVTDLSNGLGAFYTDMLNYVRRMTIIVQTEFGRRLKENGSDGTDHGHGGLMMVIHGGLLKGGRVHGTWPGLATDQLDNRVDLAITADYRAVLSEVLTQRMGSTDVASVFPGFSGTPISLFVDPATLTNKVYLPTVLRNQ